MIFTTQFTSFSSQKDRKQVAEAERTSRRKFHKNVIDVILFTLLQRQLKEATVVKKEKKSFSHRIQVSNSQTM